MISQRLAIGIAAALASTVTSAQETQLPAVQVNASTDISAPAFRAATVRSATKTDTAPLDVAQTVNVVEQALIREQRVIRMEDALRNVPGVFAGASEGRRDTFTIRGFSAELDTYVDGVRDTAGYRDFSNIERVEVLKGPAAMLFGRGSAGGIINRVSKKPTAETHREVQATVGSNQLARAEWDLGGAISSEANYRLTGAYESAGQFRKQINNELANVAGGVELRIAPATSLLAQFELQNHKRTPDRGIPSLNGMPADVPTDNFYGERFDFSSRNMQSGSLTLDHIFSADTRLTATLRATSMQLDAMNTRNLGLANNNTEVRRQTLRFPKSKDFVFAQTEVTHTLRTGSSEHLFLTGYEHGQQKGRLEVWRTTAPNISLSNPTYTAPTPLFSDANKTYDTRFTGTTDALYVQDQITLSEQWKAIAGLRYDIFAQHQDAGLINAVQGAAMDRTDARWSPRTGLIYQPSATTSWYVSGARSFQPKSEDLLFASAGDRNLDPTQSTQYEIGNKNEFFDRKLSVNVALYRIAMTDVANTDPASGQTVQIGEQLHEGLEVDASGELGNDWRVYGGTTWLNPRISKSIDPAAPAGNRPANVPTRAANVWLSKGFASGWRAGLGAYYVGDRFAYIDNTVTLPAYTRIDAALSWTQKNTELSLNLRNLADRVYYESATNNNQIAPGTSRSVMLTARFGF